MKNHRFLLPLRFAVLAISMTQATSGQDAASEPSKAKSVFLIGNSLTWDTVPSLLDGEVQWHVDCGKSLPFIFANPEMPCVKTSTLWPQALREKHYDIVSFQTHYGATLAEDVETISKWIALQPKAVIVIHTGWAHHEKRAAEYASTETSGKMQHSPAYVGALLAELKQKFPDREFRQTRAIDLLDHIAADIQAGRAPLTDVVDLHRDAIHMKLDSGRYLMHNAMRHALGQPRSNRGFEKLDPNLKAYLDTVLDRLQTQKPE
ncbi:hypothetical protein GC176_17685 [bacterium]|nr:hypothetical protein [bacterium]